jgi:RNA polymerase sigma factor (sigma-70 family)
LYILARHAWVDLARKSQRWHRGQIPGADANGQPMLTRVFDWERLDLQDAMNDLPSGHRMVLVLSLYNGMLYEEISTVMEIPVGTVKSRVFHALRKLREAMATDATS